MLKTNKTELQRKRVKQRQRETGEREMVLVYINDLGPKYLKEHLSQYLPTQALRSLGETHLAVPPAGIAPAGVLM